jgi:hypothetical protein
VSGSDLDNEIYIKNIKMMKSGKFRKSELIMKCIHEYDNMRIYEM